MIQTEGICCKTCLCGALLLLQGQQQAVAATPPMLRRELADANADFLTYQTATDVSNTAAIDVVQSQVEAKLALSTNQGFQEATQLYEGSPLRAFSSDAKQNMMTCAAPPCFLYDTFTQFTDYYGVDNYADQMVQAALEGRDTSSFSNGQVDFGELPSLDGRGEAIKVTTVALNLWMGIIQALSQAVDDCDVKYWDEAVALYVGSQQAAGQGKLLYTFAQAHCELFGTCLSQGMAKVNQDILQQFEIAQDRIKNGNCDAVVKASANAIVRLMSVPLVQGTLYSFYEWDRHKDEREVTYGRTIAFSAAILPLLHKCNPNYAYLVYSNVPSSNGATITPGTASFEVVKDALEKNYQCLGISCQDVGGVMDKANPGQYLTGAGPCGINSGSGNINIKPSDEKEEEMTGTVQSDGGNSGNNTGLIVGLGVAGGLILLFLISLFVCRKKSQSKKEFDTANDVADQTTDDDIATDDVPEIS